MSTAWTTHRDLTAPSEATEQPDAVDTRVPLLDAPSGPRAPLPPPDEGTRFPWRRIIVIGGVLLAAIAILLVVLLTRASADIAIESLEVPETIVAGDDLDVDVVLRNEGDAAGEYAVVLLVDGEPGADVTITVEPDSDERRVVTIGGLSTGSHEVAIEGRPDLTAEVRVLAPASYVVEEVSVSPEQVDLAVDPVVTVTVTYSNVGEATGPHVLALTMDGRTIATEAVLLDAGDTAVETFTVTMDTPGHPVLAVDGTTAEVWVLAPPELSLDSVVVDPNPADLSTGDVVTVWVTASNVGETDGTFTLELTHDGTIVETRDAAVAGGQTIEEQFTITLARPGLQIVSVNGVEALLDVNRIARPGNGEVVLDDLPWGPNRLVIENNRGEDVYVVLTASGDGQPPLFGVYVHAESTRSVGGLPSGSYATYFVHGDAWCTHYRHFTGDADYGRFDDDSVFESTSSTYTEVTLTFGSADGWSPTSSLDPEEFPQM